MKASELRIGNWVRFEYSGTNCSDVQINTNYFRHYELEGYVSRPIPLTEEWLVKFGFESDKKIHTLNKGKLSIHLPSDIYKNGRIYYNSWFIIDIKNECKYVHQLQNLYFALTNKELEWKN